MVKVPDKNDLMEAKYLYKGYAYIGAKHLYNTPDNDLYNREILVDFYNKHNEIVQKYFKHREKDLLILNVKEKGSYEKFCSFLGKKKIYDDFPWENKT